MRLTQSANNQYDGHEYNNAVGDGAIMKRITQILFGFMCGIFLCVAPVIANAQDNCQNCKDLFNDIGTDPNLCDLGSSPKDKCATITDNTLATICFDSVEDWCAAYRKEDGAINADDFCADTTHCTGGGGGTGGGGTGGGGTGGRCLDSNCNIGQEIFDDGDKVRVDTTSCDAGTKWRCNTKIEHYEFETDSPKNLCVTDGSCGENGCEYSTALGGVTCTAQEGMDMPFCSCQDRDGIMLYFRLSCNANTGFDYNNNIITCGSNLFCDKTHGSSGICRYKKQCSDCPKVISDWADSGTTGYQVKKTNTCNFTTGKCDIETQKYRCANGYYGRPLGLTGCEKCPDNATCITGATTFKCNAGYYRETYGAKNCATCPVPSTFSENNYTYTHADGEKGTDIGVTSCALDVGSTVEDDIGFYEIVNTQCQYQQGKQ